jgi:hypothetical protein
MPKRISNKLKDTNQIASAVVNLSTTETVEPAELDRAILSRVMSEMGRKGGKIGGKRTAERMSAVQRKKRARKAARSRWKKKV